MWLLCSVKKNGGGGGGVGPSPGFTPDHLARGAHHPGLHPSRSSPGCVFMPGVPVLASGCSLVAGKGQALHFSVSGWSPVLDRWLQVRYYRTTGHASPASWYTSSASWMCGPVTAPKSPPHQNRPMGPFPWRSNF